MEAARKLQVRPLQAHVDVDHGPQLLAALREGKPHGAVQKHAAVQDVRRARDALPGVSAAAAGSGGGPAVPRAAGRGSAATCCARLRLRAPRGCARARPLPPWAWAAWAPAGSQLSLLSLPQTPHSKTLREFQNCADVRIADNAKIDLSFQLPPWNGAVDLKSGQWGDVKPSRMNQGD